ncbi:SagB/ThcOx family dehydrogenase [Kaarinaea lacus]
MIYAQEAVNLPKPIMSGDNSFEQLLTQRRSSREFRDDALNLPQLGQLLWAAQGITHREGLRTAPSAGALYPLEVYIAVGKVDGLTAGIYHYYPDEHKLVNTYDGDFRNAIFSAALQQPWVKQAPIVIIITAKYSRTTGKYGKRGIRYVHIESGSVAQNVYLQAAAIGLGTVVVGAFDDESVANTLRLADDVEPLILMPVGRPD